MEKFIKENLEGKEDANQSVNIGDEEDNFSMEIDVE
jgi:hypothetical protein